MTSPKNKPVMGTGTSSSNTPTEGGGGGPKNTQKKSTTSSTTSKKASTSNNKPYKDVVKTSTPAIPRPPPAPAPSKPPKEITVSKKPLVAEKAETLKKVTLGRRTIPKPPSKAIKKPTSTGTKKPVDNRTPAQKAKMAALMGSVKNRTGAKSPKARNAKKPVARKASPRGRRM